MKLNKELQLFFTLSCFLCTITCAKVLGQSYIPESEIGKMKIKPVVEIKSFAFPLKDVELLESPFKTAMEADVRFLKMLEPDRLLSQFRTHAGLEPKAKRYGGWESMGLAGHSLGHYLSACAMHYATSGDKDFLDRVNYIVDELALCQQARKTGYVGAIPREDSVFMEVAKGDIRSRGFDLNGAWAPWYTIHKIMAGLLDAYNICDNQKALEVNKGIANWAGNVLKDLTDEQIQKMLLCEYGGMNEVLVNTYALTGDKKYLDLSYKFHDTFILDSLALEKDILPGKHSNTQVPKAIGTVRRYQLTGQKKDYTIAAFFWNTVVQHHTYAPGGNSNYEYLGPRDQLSEKLTDNTMETCNTYNMLKLTRHLFALQPSANYMDYYERALLNHILASQNHHDGMMCYFVPLRMGTRKEFSDVEHSFTCCVGSGMENHVKYGESIFFEGRDGSLYVNLFIPSKLTWEKKGLEVTMNSNIPADENVTLQIKSAKGAEVPIKIRKPYWSKDVTVSINGKPVKDLSVNQEGYITLNKKWKTGDKVVITLPASLHAMAMPDNQSRKAFFYGPVLLAGNLGKKEPDPTKGVPVFVTSQQDLSQWIKPDNKQLLVFKSANTGKPADVTLQPFYGMQDDFYTVYWDVFSPEGWKEQEKIYEENRRKERDLEARTVDILRVGEMQPERDHNFTGENTETGESFTRKWRIANDGGSFTFTMKALPDAELTLICTYWGMDNRGRNFEILVDGQAIASEDLNKYKESKFYDISYTIPKAVTAGKNTITVKFQAKPKNQAGPVYGVRLVNNTAQAVR